MLAPRTPADLPTPYSGPPLTIAYVGNFRHSWCTEVHVAASLELLGHIVIRLQEDETAWKGLAGTIQAQGTQLLLWTRTWPAEMTLVGPELAELSGMGIPSVSYHLDRWFGLDRQHQVDDQPFFRTDLVVSPDDSPLWAEHGVNHFWLPPGVFGPECEPVAPNPKRWAFDVVFVGSHPYPHPEWAKYRSDLLRAFQKAFGSRFGILPRRNQPIRGRDLQELYSTVPVVLGDSCLAGESHRYWSDRVPETLGRGGLLIHPYVDGMTPWYEGEAGEGPGDFLGYSQGYFTEAVGMARWALEGKGDGAVRNSGRETVVGRDTYAHRMGTVLAVAETIHGGYRVVEPAVLDVPTVVNAEATVRLARRWAAQPSRHSVQLHRWSAVFEPRPGTTDSEVIGEVWRNDYRVPPECFRGTVVDVGANVGAFSVLAAKAGAVRVVAVEPEVGNRDRLVHHLSLNGATNVEVLPWAITDGATDTVVMRGSGGGARSVENWVDVDQQHVPVLTLQSLLHVYSEPDDIELLKMDIEGGEYAAFSTCPVEALACVERMSIEFHGPAMPHLTHLNDDGLHVERWGAMVAKLADAGRIEIMGHPMRGGLIWWSRY